MTKFSIRSISPKKIPILSIFSLLTVSNFALAFCVSEYFRRQSFGSILSFDSSDQPGPLDTVLYPPRALFGTHYFGDFFQILQMSKLDTPYVSANGKLISQYPPIGHWILYPFTLLTTRAAVMVYICLAVVILFFTLRKLTELIDPRERSHVMMLFFLSGPVISMIDRGNTTVIIFCITVLSLFTKMSFFSKITLQILSIGMKFFPIVFFFEIEKQQESKKIKSSLIVEIVGVVVMTLLGMAVLGSGFRNNLLGFSHAFSDQGRIESEVRVPGVSVSAFLEGIQSLTSYSLSNQTSSFITLAIAIVALSFVVLQYVGPLSKGNFMEERVLSIMIFLSIAPKVVGTYQLIFLLIPLVLYLKRDLDKNKASVITICLVLLILPMRYEIAAGVFLNSVLFAPILVFLALNLVCVQIRRTK